MDKACSSVVFPSEVLQVRFDILRIHFDGGHCVLSRSSGNPQKPGVLLCLHSGLIHVCIGLHKSRRHRHYAVLGRSCSGRICPKKSHFPYDE